MEYWETTKARSEATLPVWTTFVPDLRVGTRGPDDLEALVDGFEPLVQARVAAQDDYDAAYREVQSALLKMKILGTKVPVLIEGHLEEDVAIMDDLDDVYKISPRSEEAILSRVRVLLPVWARANTAMAALTPAQPAITRAIQGVPHTVAMLTVLLNGYTELIKTLKEKERALNDARGTLRAHDRTCDRLNKRWYAIVKGGEMSEALAAAMEGIPTEPSTPLPEVIELEPLVQGGEGGLEVVSHYLLQGVDLHGGEAFFQYGLDTDAQPFMNEVALLVAGNTTGPFEVGRTVTGRTRVTNSAGTVTSAPRSILIEEPIG